MSSQEYSLIQDEASEIYSLPQSSLEKTFKHRVGFGGLAVKGGLFCIGVITGWIGNSLQPSVACEWSSQNTMLPSPAFEAIASEPLILVQHEMGGGDYASPYQGFPTEETTNNWKELMQGYSIRVPSATLDVLDLESIPLNDDSGDVWVSMNIYHHLHCLDSIRNQIAGVHCSNAGDGQENYFPPHIDHCLETLRTRLMCQPDLGVRAIYWDLEQPGVALANNTVASVCVNWDAIHEWTRQHTFKEDDKLITTPEGHLYKGLMTPPARCGE